MNKDIAQNIVFDIIKDIKSRKGIGGEFEQIDPEIQDEIFDEWVEIVLSGASFC